VLGEFRDDDVQLRRLAQEEFALSYILDVRKKDPRIDGKTYQDAIFDQVGILIISLEEVLEDEEDSLE